MKESDFQAKVLRYLRKTLPEAFIWKASDRFIAGIPDIVGVLNGRMFAIELKVGRNKPTALQEATIAKLKAAGASVTVAWTMEEIEAFVSSIK